MLTQSVVRRLVLAGWFAAVPGAVLAQSESIVLEEILVKVNGEIFTKTQLEERQVQVLRELRTQGTIDDTTPDADLERLLSEATPQLVVDAIDELLIVQHGREMGIELDSDRFDGIVENIKEQNNIETEEQFDEVLAAEGMTLEDLERAMERQFIMSSVQQIEIINKITMTDTEAREYYETHPLEYRIPSRITLREILIAAPTDTAAGTPADVALKQRASDARARVVMGESFAAVAAEVSDAPSKANGGLIGPLSDEDLAPAVLELLEGLAPGDVSETLRSTRGYQLFQLESATPASRRPFDDVRDDIGNRVFNERRTVEFNAFMQELHVNAILEWKNDRLREAYDVRLAAIRNTRSAGS